MGHIFEVWNWEMVYTLEGTKHQQYVKKYSGDNRDQAIQTMEDLKKAGAPCVKLEWR